MSDLKDEKSVVSKEEMETKPELLENVPEDVKKVVEFGMSMQRFSGPMPNPLFDKITSDHITTILAQSKSEDENGFTFAKQGRWFVLLIILIFVALFIFLVMYLSSDNPQLLNEIIKTVVLVAGGLGAGYGVKSVRSNR